MSSGSGHKVQQDGSGAAAVKRQGLGPIQGLQGMERMSGASDCDLYFFISHRHLLSPAEHPVGSRGEYSY